MKFNDTVFEHYNDEENIDNSEHYSDTDVDPNENENDDEQAASSFQKLLDKFV